MPIFQNCRGRKGNLTPTCDWGEAVVKLQKKCCAISPKKMPHAPSGTAQFSIVASNHQWQLIPLIPPQIILQKQIQRRFRRTRTMIKRSGNNPGTTGTTDIKN